MVVERDARPGGDHGVLSMGGSISQAESLASRGHRPSACPCRPCQFDHINFVPWKSLMSLTKRRGAAGRRKFCRALVGFQNVSQTDQTILMNRNPGDHCVPDLTDTANAIIGLGGSHDAPAG